MRCGNKKEDRKGYKEGWIGYKLHLGCSDGVISVSTVLTLTSLRYFQADYYSKGKLIDNLGQWFKCKGWPLLKAHRDNFRTTEIERR